MNSLANAQITKPKKKKKKKDQGKQQKGKKKELKAHPTSQRPKVIPRVISKIRLYGHIPCLIRERPSPKYTLAFSNLKI